jgi:negative regulator of sigma E activity
MDDSLRLIRSLYGEDVDDPDLARRVSEDEDLRREHERLQQVKDILDRRSSASPDPEVVDRVVAQAAAAQGAAAPPSDREDDAPAPDRPARTPERAWARRLQGAAAALLVVLLVGLGWWQLRPNGAAPPGPTAGETAQQQPQSVAADGPSAAPDDMPEWNDHDDLVRLHRRVETLRSRSRSDSWGTDLQTVDQVQP